MQYPGEPDEFVLRERYRRRYDYLVDWGNRTPAEAHREALHFARVIDERPALPEVQIDQWDEPVARTFPWWAA